MPKKQTIISEVASTLGAAAARVETKLAPKRSTTSKHTAKAESVPAATVETAIDRSEVARLAYLYWEARGGQNGSEEQDWLRAENDLKRKTMSAAG